MSRSARRVLSLAVVYGLLSVCARAQETPDQEAPDQEEKEEAADYETADYEAADHEIIEMPLSSGTGDETVILSPWRVGGVKGEERKEEVKKRKERVLREAEQKKRVLERRKKRVRERAKRVKRETNPLYPTNY